MILDLQQRPRTRFKDNVLNFATWNVLSLNRPESLHQLFEQASKYKIDIMAIQETRLIGNNIVDYSRHGFTLCTSNNINQHQFGVGFLISNRCRQFVIDFIPVNNRICVLRFHGRHFNISFVNVHAPTEDKSDQIKDAFYDHLESILSKIPQHDVKIILGDFNAQIGSADNVYRGTIGPNSLHPASNNNGTRTTELAMLHNLAIASTYFPHKRIHKGTWKSNDGLTVNQIDHILVSKRHFSSLKDIRSNRGANIDSDHYLVVAKYTFRLSTTYNHRFKRITRWNTEALNNPVTQTTFETTISGILEDKPYPESVEEQWQIIKMAVTDASESTIGRNPPKPKNPWLDNDCLAAIREKDRARQRNLSQSTRRSHFDYMTARKFSNRLCRRKKREWNKQQVLEIQNSNLRDKYRCIREIATNFHPRSSAIRNMSGELKVDTNTVLEVWRNYFSSLLNRHLPSSGEHLDHVPQSSINVAMTPPPPPSYDEVRNVISRMKNYKAPGEDGICSEMLKHGGDQLIYRMFELVSSIWSTETIPEEWRTALVYPLHKKGDRLNCNNYRGIALLNTGYKVLANVVATKLLIYSERILGDYQCGFRPDRSTTDQTFTLRMVLEKCYEKDIPVHCLFVDFEQAYDSIRRSSLWNILAHLGIPSKLISMCELLMNGSLCKVVIEGRLSEAFEITSGVRQGDPIAQTLFNLALEYVIRQLNIAQRSSLYYKSSQLLAYADDICILGRNIVSLKEVLLPLELTSQQIGLNINEMKTKYMVTSRRQTRGDFILGDTQYEKVKEFKYLGSMITEQNSVSSDITCRIAASYRAFYANIKIFKSRQLSRKTKLDLYKALIRPVITFGCESWTLTARDIQRLATTERKIIRIMLGPIREDDSYRMRMNHEIRNDLDNIDIIGFIKSLRLRWLGHVLRSQNRTTKQVLESAPTKVGPRGRPPIRWMDDVERDLKALGHRVWRPLVADRTVWRNIVETAKSLNGM